MLILDGIGDWEKKQEFLILMSQLSVKLGDLEQANTLLKDCLMVGQSNEDKAGQGKMASNLEVFAVRGRFESGKGCECEKPDFFR